MYEFASYDIIQNHLFIECNVLLMVLGSVVLALSPSLPFYLRLCVSVRHTMYVVHNSVDSSLFDVSYTRDCIQHSLGIFNHSISFNCLNNSILFPIYPPVKTTWNCTCCCCHATGLAPVRQKKANKFRALPPIKCPVHIYSSYDNGKCGRSNSCNAAAWEWKINMPQRPNGSIWNLSQCMFYVYILRTVPLIHSHWFFFSVGFCFFIYFSNFA